MADPKIVTYGADVLRLVSKPVENITEEIKQIAENMIRIMYRSEGVGLAAPQIGVSRRIIVLDVKPDDVDSKPIVVINPEILGQEGHIEGEEGCLSVPDIRGVVKRAGKVAVQGLDLNGNEIQIEGTELLARALQHEIDHLNGILFIDHLSRFKHRLIKKQLQRLEKETRERLEKEGDPTGK